VLAVFFFGWNRIVAKDQLNLLVDKFKGEGEGLAESFSRWFSIYRTFVRCFFAFNLRILRVQLVAVEEDDAEAS
jgi:hypothetical protein